MSIEYHFRVESSFGRPHVNSYMEFDQNGIVYHREDSRMEEIKRIGYANHEIWDMGIHTEYGKWRMIISGTILVIMLFSFLSGDTANAVSAVIIGAIAFLVFLSGVFPNHAVWVEPIQGEKLILIDARLSENARLSILKLKQAVRIARERELEKIEQNRNSKK